MSYEQITIIGHIGSVTPRESKSNTHYLELSVAVSKGSGERRTTKWYQVMLFGEMVRNMDVLLKYFTVGRLIVVEGKPTAEAYLKKDGTAGLRQTIVANSLPTLLDSQKTS